MLKNNLMLTTGMANRDFHSILHRYQAPVNTAKRGSYSSTATQKKFPV
jgi:hypothetical protein